MPIGEVDPWRFQYFEGNSCPADVLIPTEDNDGWLLHPTHRWVYDKLAVALSQGLDAAPHGVVPPNFPVFSKPIYNLHGMGVGSRVLRSKDDYYAAYAPGHFWMTLLDGEHVSTDVAVLDGEPCWWRHATGATSGEGTFDHWLVQAAPHPRVEAYCGDWVRRLLRGYTGMMNFETIDGRIIEAHLRFADQWPDLYGSGWVEALVRLYTQRAWNYADNHRRDGYSVVLFGPHGRRYRHPPASLVQELLRTAGVTSIQITFHEDRDPSRHAMPPGGFRLAITNCWDLAAGQSVRERLRAFFLA